MAGWSTWQWVILNFSQNFLSFDTLDTPGCASAVIADSESENEIWNRLKQFLPVCVQSYRIIAPHFVGSGQGHKKLCVQNSTRGKVKMCNRPFHFKHHCSKNSTWHPKRGWHILRFALWGKGISNIWIKSMAIGSWIYLEQHNPKLCSKDPIIGSYIHL